MSDTLCRRCGRAIRYTYGDWCHVATRSVYCSDSSWARAEP